MGDVRRRTRASTGEVELEPMVEAPQEPEAPIPNDAPVAKLDAKDMHRFKEQQRIIRDAQMVLSMLNFLIKTHNLLIQMVSLVFLFLQLTYQLYHLYCLTFKRVC